jgi:uncharacterized protein (DUF2062 family)
MVRKLTKRLHTNRFDKLLQRYKISQHFFAINRKLVSRAVLIGTFFALMPIPTQIAMVIGLSFFFRFNIVIALTLVWLTNPITMPAVYYGEYWLGSTILQSNPVAVELSMQWLQAHYSEILWPVTVGALVAGTILSVTFYALVNALWINSVKRSRARTLQKNNDKGVTCTD